MGFPIRVLLVEDEGERAERLREACVGGSDGQVAVSAAADGGDARRMLDEGEFDLVVYALAEGTALVRELRERHPGVPVIVHAGAESLGSINELLALARQEDLFGTDTERPMIGFHPDDELDGCADAIRAAIAGYSEVAKLAIEAATPLELTTSEARAVQIFARRTGASAVKASRLGGGLSGAKTVIVDATDGSGMRTAHVVGKLAPVEAIPSAVDGYEHAIPHLPAGLGAGMAGVVSAGAGDVGAVFFRLADDFHRTWFECLGDAPADAAAAAARLHARFRDRYGEAPVEGESVIELRRDVISDDELTEAVEPVPSIRHLEDRVVEVRRDIQHRDLHGLNVLVSDSNEPLLIDYDNYAPANSALDPVTLELSALFHRDEGAQAARRGWPSSEQARGWFDLDVYLVGCPYPEAIRACREWALDAAASPGELAATVIAVALRQFWFENTDKRLAATLIEAGESRLTA
jgi:DNA-binding NarL/FixJ family response regulator